MKIPTQEDRCDWLTFMFDCDTQDSCLLYSYLNGGQRKICEANNHDQIIYSLGQGIVRHLLNFGEMFLTVQSFKR